MRCHSCGTVVREGQKFCMECGASLRGVADVTGEVPVVGSVPPPPDDATRELVTVPPPPPTYAPPQPSVADNHTVPLVWQTPPAATSDVTAPVPVHEPSEPSSEPTRQLGSAALAVPATRTHELRVIEATEAPADRTAEVPTVPARTGQLPATPTAPAARPVAPVAEHRRFRLRPLLLVAVLTGGAVALAVLATVITVAPPPDGTVPDYAVNDFGTNNAIAGVIAASAMLIGALAWCAGQRWGAGLVGGAGAALAGWAAVILGAAEWRLNLALPDADASRSIGYWSLGAAGALGIVALIGSFASAGRDRRNGLDPWIAALAAVSFVIAAGGPLIPEGSAGWASNWTGDNPGNLPTLFFVGRAVQLGLVVVCGVLGCLLVRRWGLGLAVGGSLAAGWLLATSATDRTESPIGPGYSNPLFTDNEPHAVTIVGFALAGFFCLVAVVMALLDVDR